MTPTEAIVSLLTPQVTVLIAGNASRLADTMIAAEDGKAAASLSCKLVLVRGRVYAASKLTTSVSFSDETESASVELEDPQQPKLPALESESPRVTPTITVNYDNKCSQCGKPGATKSGLCLICAGFALARKRSRS